VLLRTPQFPERVGLWRYGFVAGFSAFTESAFVLLLSHGYSSIALRLNLEEQQSVVVTTSLSPLLGNCGFLLVVDRSQSHFTDRDRRVVQIEIFSLDRPTVYSRNFQQFGLDKSNDLDSIEADSAQPISQFSDRTIEVSHFQPLEFRNLHSARTRGKATNQYQSIKKKLNTPKHLQDRLRSQRVSIRLLCFISTFNKTKNEQKQKFSIR